MGQLLFPALLNMAKKQFTHHIYLNHHLFAAAWGHERGGEEGGTRALHASAGGLFATHPRQQGEACSLQFLLESPLMGDGQQKVIL